MTAIKIGAVIGTNTDNFSPESTDRTAKDLGGAHASVPISKGLPIWRREPSKFKLTDSRIFHIVAMV